MLWGRVLRVGQHVDDVNDPAFQGDAPGNTAPPGSDGISLDEHLPLRWAAVGDRNAV
jgi:hypothetical protein